MVKRQGASSSSSSTFTLEYFKKTIKFKVHYEKCMYDCLCK
jgi:hypothetical protein